MKASAPHVDDEDLMDDSDGTPEGLSDMSDSDDDETGSGAEKAGLPSGSDDEEDSHGDSGSELDFIEDEDDLLSVGSQPLGLIDWDSEVDGEPEEGEWGGISGQGTESKKRKGKGPEDGRKKKKARRDLPTFASLDDYEAMIDAAPEDNI